MEFYPSLPPVLAFVGLFWLANTRLFASADLPPSPRTTRIQTIDGLRGFLALGVMMFHGAVYHRYLLEGVWAGPPGNLYTLLGTGGVAVFFMITGYLFWDRLIEEAGHPDWVRLYTGRIFRITPLYLCAILAMVCLVMGQAGWTLNVTPADFVRELAPWLALGLLDPTDLNRHPATLILTAGVTWSLRYEWLFYLSLPVIAVAAGAGNRRTAVTLLALAGGFVWSRHGGPWLLGPGDPSYATLFLLGMACALLGRRGWNARIGNLAGSVVIVVLLLTLLLTCQIAYSPLAMALLGASFYLVVSGCSLFGLLTHRASKRMGDVSYGIYLLQGLVLAWLFQYRAIRDYALGSPARHWSVILAAAVILLCLAAVAHIWIERPGIALGQWVGRRLQSALSPRARHAAPASPDTDDAPPPAPALPAPPPYPPPAPAPLPARAPAPHP